MTETQRTNSQNEALPKKLSNTNSGLVFLEGCFSHMHVFVNMYVQLFFELCLWMPAGCVLMCRWRNQLHPSLVHWHVKLPQGSESRKKDAEQAKVKFDPQTVPRSAHENACESVLEYAHESVHKNRATESPQECSPGYPQCLP